MRSVLGGVVCACVAVSATVAARADTTTQITGTPAVVAPDNEARPVPLPRVRPAKAPQPVEPMSQRELCDALAASAQRHRLPLAFFGNLIYQESGLKPRVVSRAGARGIAQFMPKTARLVGLKDPFNPRQALPASARFLRGLLHRFGNNYGLAAAAYNAGPARVGRWLKRGGALPRETRNYVVKITGKPAHEWRGRHGVSFAHDLTERIPCAELKVYAELENNPASAHSTRPVRFVLPVPKPHPLRPNGVDDPALIASSDTSMPPATPEPPPHAHEPSEAAPRQAKSMERLPLPRARPLRFAQASKKR